MTIFLPPLRPPGAIAEAKFYTACIRCGKCIEACPHDSIKMAGGFGRGRLLPVVDPAKAPCQLCMKCTPICPTGALDQTCDHMEKVKMGRAHILKDRCLNYTGGTMCWTCYDRCPLRGQGIVLKDGIIPSITDDCAGCGVCEHVCPHQAIMTVPAAANITPDNSADRA